MVMFSQVMRRERIGRLHIAAGKAWQILSQLGHGHVLAGNEAREDRTAVSRVLAVRRRAFLPPCPVDWIRLLELRLNREQGVRRDGPILEMRGQLEALHQ